MDYDKIVNEILGKYLVGRVQPIRDQLKLAIREAIDRCRESQWIPVSEKPKRAGWYNVMRETDGHTSVRVWDDSDETWYYVGDTHKLWHPNNAFTHYQPLPEPPAGSTK